VQFPDPHWKMRNRKKRIVQPQLVEAVAKLLAAGGRVFLQSDVQEVRPPPSKAQTYTVLLLQGPILPVI